LAETIDRIVESDDVLRAAVGMPERSQNTGSPAASVTRRYSLTLCFFTDACCSALSTLVSHVSCSLLFVIYVLILARCMTNI